MQSTEGKDQYVQKIQMTNYDNWDLMKRWSKKMSHFTWLPPDDVIKIYDHKEAKHLYITLQVQGAPGSQLQFDFKLCGLFTHFSAVLWFGQWLSV